MGSKVESVYDVLEWDREMRDFRDKDRMWQEGYTKEFGPWRGWQYSPQFHRDSCQRCGMFNYCMEKCTARGDNSNYGGGHT